MKTSSYLSAPTTRAEVFGWLLTTPVVAWAVVFVPVVYPLPAKFTEIFTNFEVPLPLATSTFLAMGGLGLALLISSIALVPVAVVLFSRRAWPKLVAPVACGVAMFILHGALVRSLFEPIEQLTLQLTGQPK
jgi:type II secretory pathway component PulF